MMCTNQQKFKEKQLRISRTMKIQSIFYSHVKKSRYIQGGVNNNVKKSRYIQGGVNNNVKKLRIYPD